MAVHVLAKLSTFWVQVVHLVLVRGAVCHHFIVREVVVLACIVAAVVAVGHDWLALEPVAQGLQLVEATHLLLNYLFFLALLPGWEDRPVLQELSELAHFLAPLPAQQVVATAWSAGL